MNQEEYLIQVLQDIKQVQTTLSGIQKDIVEIQLQAKKVDKIEEHTKALEEDVKELQIETKDINVLEDRLHRLEDSRKSQIAFCISVITALAIEIALKVMNFI